MILCSILTTYILDSVLAIIKLNYNMYVVN